MKIKTYNLYVFALFTMIFGYMLGPMLSYKVGVPRVDNPLTVLFVAVSALAFVFGSKTFPARAGFVFACVSVMCGWPAVQFFLSTLSPTRIMDIMFFMVLPGFFYFLYLVVSRSADPLGWIRKFTACLVLFIAVPPFAELLTGIQFVAATDDLTIESGALKGLFFNPNNLATAAVCLSPAVLFFFVLSGTGAKQKLAGWLLFFMLGAAIFASVSRTAIGCYLLILFLYVVYQKNGLLTAIITAVVCMLLSLIPSHMIQEFLLSLNGNEFLERFSSRLYLFLYDFGSDSSVSYRQEMYNYFWNNPPLLFTGYGPKNFREYFGGHLSTDLGFENPHSFIIELYLSFGLVALAAFAAYAAAYAASVMSAKGFDSKQRFFALLALAVFLVAGFIPSTIFRMPFIWLPCFLIFIYTSCHRPRTAALTD